MEDRFSHNYRLVVEYDGRAFHGWQKQPGLVTVQQELERVIQTVLHSTDTSGLQAAGRTDAGVHARGQVVNFRTNIEINPLIFKHSVSSMLKGRLAVLDVAKVPFDFHSLRSASARQYVYRILNRPAPAVLDYGRVWHVGSELNRTLLQEEAKVLIGEHDFSSFQGAGCESTTRIKQIFESEILFDGPRVTFRVLGKGFLKQMVRIIVGTLIQRAKGKIPERSMAEILDKRDRTAAGVTAPSHGLYLDYVQYNGWNSRLVTSSSEPF